VIEVAMRHIGKWFIANQTATGDFTYELDVATGKPSAGYNIVRQAGSLYSLAQLYREYRDPTVKETLERGFAFFETLTVFPKTPSARAILHHGAIQSNTSALLLLALAEYSDAEPERKAKYEKVIEGLANYLMATQKPSGGFINRYPDEESDYNNGESFYALVRAYEVTGKKEYLQSAKKAALYMMEKYRMDEFNDEFFPWGMAGFAHLYRLEPNVRYWRFMREQTDAFFAGIGASTERFFYGISSRPPKGNIGVFLEGISQTALVAKAQDEAYFRKIEDFMKPSIDYLLTLQVNGPASKRYSPIATIQGGMCYNFDCQTERIDITHHALSALYWYLNVFYEE